MLGSVGLGSSYISQGRCHIHVQLLIWQQALLELGR
jgi:hypothetical protein